MIKIQKENFNVEEEISSIKKTHSNVGAVTSFIGYVRDNNNNTNVQYIDLEVYEKMAHKHLENIIKEASLKWNLITEEFKNLLKTQFTKTKNLEEGKVISCIVSKLTSNYCYLSADGLKQEPILDINELRTLGLLDGLKEGSKIDVLLERLESPRNGEIIVSAEKAIKLAGWNRIVEMYSKEEPVTGKILRKCKGGAEVSIDELGLVAFLPVGSPIIAVKSPITSTAV